MPIIIAHVGLPALLEWMGHVAMLGIYTVADATLSRAINEETMSKEER